MNALQILRDRIQREADIVEVQAANRSLEFSFETMDLLQQFVAQLPDLRTEWQARIAPVAAWGEKVKALGGSQ